MNMRNEIQKELSPTHQQSEKKKESSAGNNESQMEEIDINFFN